MTSFLFWRWSKLFFHFGEISNPPPKKKFYNIDQHWLQNLDFLSKELHNIQALNFMLKTSPYKSSVKQKTFTVRTLAKGQDIFHCEIIFSNNKFKNLSLKFILKFC